MDVPEDIFAAITALLDHTAMCDWRLTHKRASKYYSDYMRRIVVVSDGSITDEELSTLTYLTHLYVFVPLNNTVICKLTGLVTLHLHNNDTITARALRTLPQLSELGLDYGGIAGADLVTLTSIRTLNIHGGDILSRHIMLMTNVQSLILGFNPYISTLPCTLTCLDVTNALTSVRLHTLTNLTELTMGSHWHGQYISMLTNLTTLDIERNNNVTDMHLALLTNLRTLNISYATHIRNIGMLTGLTRLSMPGTYLKDGVLGTLTNLERLYMDSHCKYPMPKLRHLRLIGNIPILSCFAENYPALHTLNLKYCSDDVLESVSLVRVQTIIVDTDTLLTDTQIHPHATIIRRE